MRKILVTGAAGFIGSYVSELLLKKGLSVVGIDNLNDYYDVSLKKLRLKRLSGNFEFQKIDLTEGRKLKELFAEKRFDGVVHLAAQAGVRHSLKNPQSYIDSNMTGFLSILECCRDFPVAHLVYASSSSVYGRNSKTPFSIEDPVCLPASLYAVTKRANELMAETYRHLFGVNSTGLRFFTVYGPWGRPDMAPWLFAEAILENRPIRVFNQGKMLRDFTYIDDIAEGVLAVLEAGENRLLPEHKLYNIGHGSPVNLMDFISTLERFFGKEAEKEFFPMQPGDVEMTFADTTLLTNEIGYRAKTDLSDGVKAFADWFLQYRAEFQGKS